MKNYTKCDIEINVSAENVWESCINLEAYQSIISSISSVERISNDGPNKFEVGTSWKETRIDASGREETMVLTVTSISSPTSSFFPKEYKVESDGHGCHFTSIVTVDDDMNITTEFNGSEEKNIKKSKLTMTFQVEPTTIFARLMIMMFGSWMLNYTNGMLQKDLDEICAYCEKEKQQQ